MLKKNNFRGRCMLKFKISKITVSLESLYDLKFDIYTYI